LERRLAPAVFPVTTVADSGPGSLRQAVADANALAGADTVTFDATVFAAPTTIVLTGGSLSVTDDLVVNGPAAKLTLSGNTTSRVLTLTAAAPLTVVLNDLRFIDGLTAGGGGAVKGGDDSLTLNRCELANNTATTGNGGAVDVDAGGLLTAEDCAFNGNTAVNGGAVAAGGVGTVDGRIVLRRCTLSGNAASFDGGAINSDGYILIADSTLSANTSANATGGGGAIRHAGQFGAPAFIVRNSTLSGNSAVGTGGAIRLFNSTGLLTIQNSTIVGNTANGANGGGIAREGGTTTVTIESSIVALNVNAASADLFSAGTVNATVSLIGSKTGVTTFNADAFTTTNLSADPLLGPLQKNGGPTLTHQPAAASPAINNGSNPAGLANDQRGAGFPRAVGTPDIGAIELRSFVVTNDADAGAGSLRQAVLDSEALAGADTIVFEPTFFGSSRTISLLTALPLVATGVTIQGPGAALLTVRRDPAAAANFAVLRFSGSGVVSSVSDMTVTGGTSGGVTVQGQDVTLERLVISGNTGGSGAFVNSGTLTVRDSIIAQNQFAGNGGGILALDSSLTVEGSALTANDSGLRGGGLNSLGTGSLAILGTTISGNTAASHGGGVYIDLPTTHTIRNCTISGNGSKARGGGIALNQSIAAATLRLRNSTVTANTAATAGGGIASLSNLPRLLLQSSVVAGNLHPGSPDISMTGLVEVGNSLVGGAAGFTPSDLGGNLAFGTNPLLGALANNGGPTQTHALLAGSPLINSGSNPTALTTDQRGAGFARVVGGQADIGAFEVQLAVAKIAAVQVNGGAAQRSRVTSLVVTFDQPPELPASPADGFQLRRQSDNAAVTLAGSVAGNAVTLTFNGGPLDFGSLADGRYTLTVLAAQVPNLDGNGDGTAGDDFTLVGDPSTAPKLFRLFGDNDGDGDVDAADFGQFRQAFGTGANLAFDFDGDGDVDASDFGQFRQRFGTAV
jgi:hypothetical protein